jgi:amino acid transporter
VVGVGAALALLVNIGQSALFTALTSICIGFLYIAYLGVTVPALLRRMKEELMSDGTVKHVDETGKPLFSLGKWGILVNFIAVVYQLIAAFNLMWPRSEIYDLTGHTWWLKWSALLFLALTLLVGVGIHVRNRSRFGKLTLSEIEEPTLVAAA